MVTGVECVVVERKGSMSRVVGDKVFARVVLRDGEYQVGGVAIALTDQSSSSLLDLLSGAPDVDDLADWYGQTFSQPPNRSPS